MKSSTCIEVVIASLCLACTAFGADQSSSQPMNQPMETAQPATTVDIKQLPAPVQTTLAREGDHIDKVQQQVRNGSTVYQATVSKRGKSYSLDIAKDITVLKRQSAEDRQ